MSSAEDWHDDSDLKTKAQVYQIKASCGTAREISRPRFPLTNHGFASLIQPAWRSAVFKGVGHAVHAKPVG